MDSILPGLLSLLVQAGPWIIFLVAMTESAFFIGLLIPAEATVLLGAFLADRGVFSLSAVAAATFFGGLLGDQIGYALGRYGGRRIAAGSGLVGRLWRRHERAAGRLFQQRAALAVTVARFISFVRTLMPWFAGMSGISYPRYLAYDALGVLGWATASIALGYAAGESWQLVASRLGSVSAIIVLLLVIVILVIALRRRFGHRFADLEEAGADETDPAGAER